MSISDLLSKPEFWSALFGALAAFLLGALATWWAATAAKRTAGNLTLVVLSQMYGLMENLRYKMFVDEPMRYFAIAKRPPLSFQLRGTVGLPSHLPPVPFDDLGFLADSHDPDLMNRLLQVERAVSAMLDMARRHQQLHAEMTARLSATDPAGDRPMTPRGVAEVVGVKVLIEIDDTVDDLRVGLPGTRENVMRVAKELRHALRLQFPLHRFVALVPVPPSRSLVQPPGLPDAAIWRYVARWIFDTIREPTPLPAWMRSTTPAAPAEPEAPEVRRFPPRSYDQPAPGSNVNGPVEAK